MTSSVRSLDSSHRLELLAFVVHSAGRADIAHAMNITASSSTLSRVFVILRRKLTGRRRSVPSEASLGTQIVVRIYILFSVCCTVYSPAAAFHLYLLPMKFVLVTVWPPCPRIVIHNLHRVRDDLATRRVLVAPVVRTREVSVRSVAETRGQVVEHAHPALRAVAPLPRVADPALADRVHAQLLALADVRDRRARRPICMSQRRITKRSATRRSGL